MRYFVYAVLTIAILFTGFLSHRHSQLLACENGVRVFTNRIKNPVKRERTFKWNSVECNLLYNPLAEPYRR